MKNYGILLAVFMAATCEIKSAAANPRQANLDVFMQDIILTRKISVRTTDQKITDLELLALQALGGAEAVQVETSKLYMGDPDYDAEDGLNMPCLSPTQHKKITLERALCLHQDDASIPNLDKLAISAIYKTIEWRLQETIDETTLSAEMVDLQANLGTDDFFQQLNSVLSSHLQFPNQETILAALQELEKTVKIKDRQKFERKKKAKLSELTEAHRTILHKTDELKTIETVLNRTQMMRKVYAFCMSKKAEGESLEHLIEQVKSIYGVQFHSDYSHYKPSVDVYLSDRNKFLYFVANACSTMMKETKELIKRQTTLQSEIAAHQAAHTRAQSMTYCPPRTITMDEEDKARLIQLQNDLKLAQEKDKLEELKKQTDLIIKLIQEDYAQQFYLVSLIGKEQIAEQKKTMLIQLKIISSNLTEDREDLERKLTEFRDLEVSDLLQETHKHVVNNLARIISSLEGAIKELTVYINTVIRNQQLQPTHSTL